MNAEKVYSGNAKASGAPSPISSPKNKDSGLEKAKDSQCHVEGAL